jgi:hypothetical protein
MYSTGILNWTEFNIKSFNLIFKNFVAAEELQMCDFFFIFSCQTGEKR